MLNDHFTNVIIQNIIKTKFTNNYKAYVTMKNKIMKMQHNSLCTLTKRVAWRKNIRKLSKAH